MGVLALFRPRPDTRSKHTAVREGRLATFRCVVCAAYPVQLWAVLMNSHLLLATVHTALTMRTDNAQLVARSITQNPR